MKKLFYFVLCTIVLGSCGGHVLTEEEAKKAVLEGERDRLPLVIQKMEDVESIVIDSLRIRVKDEPMSGFLYTTWKYNVTTSYYPRRIVEKREKSIIVSVDSIRQSRSHDGYVEWMTDWGEAYRVIIYDKY